MDTTQFNLIIVPRLQRESRQNEARNQQTAGENTADAFAQMLRDQMKTNRQAALSVGGSTSGGTTTSTGSGQQNSPFANDMALQQRQAVTKAADQRVTAKAAERNRLNDEAAKARADRHQGDKEAQSAAAAKAKDAIKDGKDLKEVKDAKKNADDDKSTDNAAAADTKQQPSETTKTPAANAKDDQQSSQDGKKQQDQTPPQQQAADANGQPADAEATAVPAAVAAAITPVTKPDTGNATADAKAAGAGQIPALQPGATPADSQIPAATGQAAASGGQSNGVPGNASDAPGTGQTDGQVGDQASGLASQQPTANPAALLPVAGDAGGKATAPQAGGNALPSKSDKAAPALPSLPGDFSDAAKSATAPSEQSPLQAPAAKGLAERPVATKNTGPIDLVRAPQAVVQTAQPQQQATVTPAASPSIDKSSMDADSGFNGDASGSFDDGAGSFGGLGSWQMPQLSSLNSARQADFVAALKQQLGTLPPHEQVAVQMQRAAQNGVDKISIQLSPEELGRIHVKMDIDDEKKVRASVTVERPATLELLQRDSRALERALQDAGLKTDGGSLSFNLQRGNTGDFSDSSGWGQGNGRQTGSAESANTAGLTETSVKPAEIDTANGIVDVQV